MTYSKPEIAVLGDASVLVQGVRISGLETTQPQDFKKAPADCEFDD